MRLALATCRSIAPWEVDDRPLELALAGRGATVHTPAWDDPEVAWPAFDAVFVRTTWDYTARRDAFLAWVEQVAATVPLLNPLALIRWNTHKSYLAALADWGVPVVPTVYVGPQERVDLVQTLRDRGWARGFVKPVVGASAVGARRLGTPPTAADQAHVDGLAAAGGAMIQPYRSSVEEQGEVSAILVEGRFSHAVRKVPPAGDFRVQDDYGAVDRPYDMPVAERAVAERAVAEVGRRLERPLVARVDMLDGPEGPEVNELELVEPSLFLRHDLDAAARIAEALLCRITGAAGVPIRPELAPRARYPVVILDLHGAVVDRGRERMVPGMLEMLVDLRVGGARLGVATREDQEAADQATARHRLAHWIATVHGARPAGRAPSALVRALDALHARPDETVFVGDGAGDVRQARGLGLTTVGVSWGADTRTDLERAGAHAVAIDPDALRALLLVPGRTGAS